MVHGMIKNKYIHFEKTELQSNYSNMEVLGIIPIIAKTPEYIKKKMNNNQEYIANKMRWKL